MSHENLKKENIAPSVVTEAVVLPDGRFNVRGQICFELPPGSHRPEQMVLTELLKSLIPVAEVLVGTVKDEPGNTRYFSKFTDVTSSDAPVRSIETVRAEYVALREIFLCRDRSFEAKAGYNYPSRKAGVRGHNMDWVPKNPEATDVSAIHYDFELFFNYLKYMKELWIDESDAETKSKRVALITNRLDEYVDSFGPDFLHELKVLLEHLERNITLEKVSLAVDTAVAQQILPEVETLYHSLQNKIALYKTLIYARLAQS